MNETEHDRWRNDLAAYALGALEPGEAAELERHLAGCEECEVELGWLRPAVQLLPESVERLEPPQQLRERLIEQVRSEARPQPARRSRHGRLIALRPLAGLAAVALIVAAVAGYAISGGGSDGGSVTTVAAGHAPGVTAKIVREGNSGTLRLANVHALPADKVLQAWVQRGKRIESAKTLFLPNRDGTATAVLDDMQGVSAVMVTMEPRGGSAQPTTSPMVTVSMPS